MIIKKFVGKTEEEAVERAKSELGNSVVIMNVRSVKPKGLFGSLRPKQSEVTVALEEEKEEVAKETRENRTSTIIRPAASGEQKPRQLGQQSSSEIEKKLENLQSLLEKQIIKSRQPETAEKEPEKEEPEKEEAPEEDYNEQDKFIKLLYNTMIENEVDEKYANQMLEEIQRAQKKNMPLDYILSDVYQKMVLRFGRSEGIRSSQKGPMVVVFLGPTGVGKTTTIAKLSGSYVMEKKKKVALFTTDTYRIAATQQLKTYADILEVPFRVIYTEEEFAKAVDEFQEYDYIFVDTSGHSHQNEQQLGDMKKFIDFMKGIVTCQCFLVMSATTKYKDLMQIAENYRTITEYQLIFTKLDETTELGNIFNLKLVMDTPVAYVTYGQNVPNDIEEFNPQKTVKQLLGGR